MLISSTLTQFDTLMTPKPVIKESISHLKVNENHERQEDSESKEEKKYHVRRTTENESDLFHC